MNKKGSVSFNITGKVILGILVFLLLIIAFIFPKVRVILIGLAFLGAALLIAVNGKLNRTRSVFVIMFLALGLVIIFFGNNLIGQTQFTGSNTLSLQQVQYLSSSNACFDSNSGPLWLYTIKGGGALGQLATGSYSPAEAGDLYSGNTEPAKIFTIKTSYNQFCDYKITTNPYATPIYTLTTPFVWTVPFLKLPTVNECGIEAATKSECTKTGQYYYGHPAGGAKCWCSSYNTQSGAIANYIDFNTAPSVRTTGTITYSSGTDTVTTSMASNSNDIKVAGPNVCAVWEGQLTSGENCGAPNTNGGIALPVYTAGNWELISQDAYDTYKNKWDGLKTALNSGTLTEADITSKINELNQYANAALGSKLTFGTINNPTSQSGAVLTKELSTFIQYPIITMYIKASWLGVITPVPKASITTAPTSECFVSGSAGSVNLGVKNTGEEGVIQVTGTCDKGFTISKDSQSYTSGETKDISLTLTGSSNTTTTNGTCTITSSALTQSVSKQVNVCVTGIPTCEQTEPWCESGNMFYCPTPFSPDTIKEDCLAKGQVCELDENGVANCVSNKAPVCGDGICNGKETFASCPVDCTNNLKCDEKTPKFLGWTEVTTEKQTIWSTIGIAKPKVNNWCKPTNAPYIVGGVLALILGLSALFIIPKKKTKGKASKYGKIGK